MNYATTPEQATQISEAIAIAARVHAGQVDKGGEAYIMHPLAVMRLAEQATRHMATTAQAFRQRVILCAILHDVLEDCDWEPVRKQILYDDIQALIGPEAFGDLLALTHLPSESYEFYIERVAARPVSRIVKIADLTHNMDPRRLPAGQIGDKEFRRWDKYRKSLVRLEREI
jgi:(p)ppGpp synthase/HD superfamily hydrolase